MKFNEKLHMLRAERGMTLSDFAELLGTSKQVLSRYEHGENTPKITTVMNYANKLNISLAFLINDDIEDRYYGIKKDEEIKLSEDENILINMYRSVSEEKKNLLFEMIRVAMKS